MKEEVEVKIKRGLESFQTDTYKKRERVYHTLETKQNPDILYIGCSDSRVSPEVILNAEPGEIFVLRNIANKVPSLSKNEVDPTTMSAIEFAVLVLKVSSIVVCGHSNCGGCAAALSGEKGLSELPFTKHYLKSLEELSEKVTREASDKSAKEKAKVMEERNVLEQVEHLKEYAFINERLADGRLELEGWRFDIGSGQVERYDEKAEQFVPILLNQKLHTD
ncbi:carbonic anhydrase [Alkalibacterium kapii]|uniref:Carbonic anhydrase n=1 Tax=Alkalibacterium kapii TaxID=426704 RepID=A0A511ASZ1_9LACT|nr:carbonic anhydrase [Alkalibacterium kapii]GEK91314.1 carbonic anhydrase [Alkalibacterium kapii]